MVSVWGKNTEKRWKREGGGGVNSGQLFWDGESDRKGAAGK